jgi:hypothetical protein
MAISLLPTTREIGLVAAEELSRVGGTVLDRFDDGRRLFLRSVLPRVRDVRPGDSLQGGVALMCTDEEIRVHPYLFRQVCRNGAIMATALQTRHVQRVESDAPAVAVEDVTEELREALRECSAREAFCTAAEQMRSATEQEADLTLHLLPLLQRLPQTLLAGVLAEIQRRFAKDRDRSRFGLVNAVTSVARDQRVPEVRWRLEELGGGIAAFSPTRDKPDGVAADLLPV